VRGSGSLYITHLNRKKEKTIEKGTGTNHRQIMTSNNLIVISHSKHL